MSIYVCEKCGTIDNTAVGGYWKNGRNHEPKQCSECNTGKWHGEFPKRNWKELGVTKMLELEARHDGSMINATTYLTSIGELPIKSAEMKLIDEMQPTAKLDEIMICMKTNIDALNVSEKMNELLFNTANESISEILNAFTHSDVITTQSANMIIRGATNGIKDFIETQKNK